MQFDSVRIRVRDLDGATGAYELLLGIPASSSDGHRRLQLHRGAVELVQGPPGLDSLCFAGSGEKALAWPTHPEAFHGLHVRLGLPLAPIVPATLADAVDAIDHIVIQSPDLERAQALWRDRLGLRLALDREFPARSLRMLFFRSGGVTLEFVGTLAPSQDISGPDRLYGIAYRVGDLEACRRRLLNGGVDVSAVRPGHKPGTCVATVRSGSADVPTLLVSGAAG